MREIQGEKAGLLGQAKMLDDKTRDECESRHVNASKKRRLVVSTVLLCFAIVRAPLRRQCLNSVARPLSLRALQCKC